MLFQRFVKLTGYLPLWIFYKFRVYGKDKLPKGPCILAANHGSMLDAVLLQVAFPMKRISFLCAEKLFHCPRICQAFLRSLGAVPVIDGVSEMEELKRRAVNAQPHEMIGFFSQGRISKTQSVFMPGAAVLAMQTGLPLVPVFIRVAPIFRGGSRICIGEPVIPQERDIDDRKNVEQLTQEVRDRVYELSGM